MAVDRLFIDIEDRDLYKKLKDEKLFKGKSNREYFLFAMGVGFKNGLRLPLKTREEYFRINDLRAEDRALLRAVAMSVSEKGLEVLSRAEEIYNIAEEYAHSGIRLLVDKIDSLPYGSFEKHFEKELFDAYKGINTKEKE